MNTVVIKVSSAIMNKMKESYKNSLINKKVPYSEFLAKKGDTTITAYTSGKVMFQGKNAQKEAALWGDTIPPKKKTVENTVNSSILPENFSKLSVLGSDEVGMVVILALSLFVQPMLEKSIFLS